MGRIDRLFDVVPRCRGTAELQIPRPPPVNSWLEVGQNALRGSLLSDPAGRCNGDLRARLGESSSRRKRVKMRRCYDFPTVGRFMTEDLSTNVRGEMVGFVKRELLTEKWMRAQSMLDVAAARSDRPDHGSMGAYNAWPAVTVDAMCALGYWDDAIPFLRRMRAAIYEGVYAQARQFYGQTRGQHDAPVRIAQRGGCMRECSGGGAFAETTINTLFGYAAKPGAALTLVAAGVQRGFRGELHQVRHGNELFRIRSGETGVSLRKEE